MSPILVRPVREQLEHDRIIRLLQARSKRRVETLMNPGSEQNAGVGTGARAVYPDLVIYSQERGRRLQAVVEVETGESVNHLEALAEWAHFARLKVPFHLYVPAPAIDVARRLASEYQIEIAELWIYDSIGDQLRFTMVHRAAQPVRRPAAAAAPAARKPAPRPAARRKAGAPARPAGKPAAKRTAAARVRKPAARKAAAKPARRKGGAQKRR